MADTGDAQGKKFRWWGYVAPAPFALFGLLTLAVGEVGPGLLLLVTAAPLALTGIAPPIAPWWSLAGWSLVIWGAMLVVAGDAIAVGAMLLVVGLALGVTGIVIREMRRREPVPAARATSG